MFNVLFSCRHGSLLIHYGCSDWDFCANIRRWIRLDSNSLFVVRESSTVNFLTLMHGWLLYHDSVRLNQWLSRLAMLFAWRFFYYFIILCYFWGVLQRFSLWGRCHLSLARFRMVLMDNNYVSCVRRNTGLVFVSQLVHGPWCLWILFFWWLIIFDALRFHRCLFEAHFLLMSFVGASFDLSLFHGSKAW